VTIRHANKGEFMRRLAVLATAALLLAAPSLALAKKKESKEEKLRKPRMAILNFPAASGAISCGGWGNSEGRMSNVLRDLFTTEIMERADGKLRLVERERLAEIRDELKFEQSGEVDGATAQKIGKLLGVRYMLTGKMTRFACKKSEMGTGWGVGRLVGKVTGSGFAGDVAGSVKSAKVKLSGRLDVRLIDTQTGEILATLKEENETGDQSVKVAGGGNVVDYDDELASRVFEPIVAKMGPKIVKQCAAAHETNLADDAEDEADEAGGNGGRSGKGGGDTGSSDSGGGGTKVARAGGDGADGGKKKVDAKEKGAAGAPSAEVYSNEFDFVPGDKVIFYDDFSDTDVGDSPIRFKGPGLVVVERDGKRWAQETKTSCGNQTVRLEPKDGDFPKKFTVEFDAVFGNTAYALTTYYRMVGAGWLGVEVGGDVKYDFIPPAGVQHVSAAVNDTYVKLYVGGKRVHQNTDGTRRPIKSIRLCMWGKDKDTKAFVTNFKIAEGGKDWAKELTSLGRIVTHGITFDSGSDRIRPESGPTLRSILKLLQDDSGLGFEIQGHTDTVGGDATNGPLSERRAAAVKAWLVSQGIADSRLTTKGLGATKPLESNETPEGRANNRRVEFVKRAG
jgi:outer membrane protein OmpA-like peptidoglycan-associated protein/curli biogenesis system outer membrane secretion channel CsgG